MNLTRVFVHGPNSEVVGWVDVDDAITLARNADCNLFIETTTMSAFIQER